MPGILLQLRFLNVFSNWLSLFLSLIQLSFLHLE